MDVTDQLIARWNNLLRRAYPKDGQRNPEAETALKMLLDALKGVSGTDIKIVRNDYDADAEVPEPPPFAPPPPDMGNAAAQEAQLAAQFAAMMESHQRQRAQEDKAHLDRMAQREHIADLEIAAKKAAADRMIGEARAALSEQPATKPKTPEEVFRDMMRKRQR